MNLDRLYDLAFQFKSVKLWRKLYDSQIFAVEHSDGGISYCCVMGTLGEHLALAAYPGEDGLAAYRGIGEVSPDMNGFERTEVSLSQDCVMCSFEGKEDLLPRALESARAYCKAHKIALRGKNAYPNFQRYRPHYFPWHLENDADRLRLEEALEAALAVAAKLENADPEALGFTEGAPFDRSIPILKKRGNAFEWGVMPLPEPAEKRYPAPQTLNDIQLGYLKKAKKHGAEWACDVFMHVQPMAEGTETDDSGFIEEPECAPVYPYMLLMLDVRSDMILTISPSTNSDDYTEEFVLAFVGIVREKGAPNRILVRTERARAFFEPIAAALDSELVFLRDIPPLEEAEQDLYAKFSDDDPVDMDEMIEMFKNPAALSKIPDEVLIQMARICQAGILPPDAVECVMAEFRKRGLPLE